MTLYSFIRGHQDNFPNLLRDFDESYNVDIEIKEVANRTNSDLFFVSHRLVDQNSSDVGLLIDRLLAYRREINAVQSEQIKAALGFIAARERIESELGLALVSLDAVSQKYIDAANESARVAKENLKALEERHSVKGSPLNFHERMLKLRYHMRSEMENLCVRASALGLGASVLYGISLTYPRSDIDALTYADFDGAGYLDDLIGWHRKMLRELEDQQGREAESEVTLSIGMEGMHDTVTVFSDLRAPVFKGQTRRRIYDGLVEGIREGHLIGFFLGYAMISSIAGTDNYYPLSARMQRPKLKAFAISVSMPVEQSSRWKFQAAVRPPLTTTDILVGDIGAGKDLTWVTDDAFINVDPRGEWFIRFSPNAIFDGGADDTAQFQRESWPILDVRLHLRIATRIDEEGPFAR